MNKQFIAVGIVIILLVVGLSGCSQKATNVNAEEILGNVEDERI